MPVTKLLDSLSLMDLKDVLAAARVLGKFGITKIDDVNILADSLEKVVAEKIERETAKYKAWKQHVQVPKEYLERSSTIADTAKRGITFRQLLGLGTFVQEVLEAVDIKDKDGRPHTKYDIHLYSICNYFVLPLTEKQKCSFVELTATAEQTPLWFVSHYWGTPFRQSVGMLAFHSRQRQLATSDAYWMCTFANNQHNLDELSGNLDETPFMRVLRSETCKGTVALMDKDASPFRRIWCILEAFQTTKETAQAERTSRLIYDVATCLTAGQHSLGDKKCQEQAVLMLNASGETKVIAEKDDWPTLPFEVAKKAARTDVRTAQASREDDSKVIRAYMLGSEEKFNHTVAIPFANKAMRNAIKENDIEELQFLVSEFPTQIDGVDPADGFTPLIYSTTKGSSRLEALKLLLKAKANVNQPKAGDWTSLHCAAEHNNVDALRTLLNTPGVKVNVVQHNGASPLYIAVEKGAQEAALHLLIEAKADVNQAKKGGWYPVHSAAADGNVSALRALLAARADAGKTLPSGETALALAQKRGHTEAASLLEQIESLPGC